MFQTSSVDLELESTFALDERRLWKDTFLQSFDTLDKSAAADADLAPARFRAAFSPPKK